MFVNRITYYSLPTLLFFSGLYALRSDIENCIDNMWVGDLLSYVYKACTTSDLFNILLTLSLVYIFYTLGKKIYLIKGSLLRCIGYIFVIVYLFTCKHYFFATISFINIDYDSLLIVSFLSLLIIDVVAIARKFLSVQNINCSPYDDQKGYCMDNVYTDYKDIGWDNYVKDLLALMPKERLKNESLAIGISGNWGSGKTSFLKNMQRHMKDDFQVISFNPWKCVGKEQIISQFFSLLREQAEKNDELLQDAIQKYRDVILDIDIHPSITFLTKVLSLNKDEESLDSLKDKIEKAIIVDGAKPFAIFIDDLDRLEGNELFEVLRLIRITANFRNVVFIVAYDRNYICNVLNEVMNIRCADEYIQKIFHLEVSLPKFENETLLEVFMEETVRILSLERSKAARLRLSVKQLFSSGKISFTDFVPNFRQARRFANIFALNFKSVITHTKDITVKDFIGIELIHFAYPDIYKTLMNKPMTLLKQKPKASSKLSVFVYKSNDNTPCAQLLSNLFSTSETTKETAKEIRAQISFANYFCYRLPNNAIGVTEFEMTMIADEIDYVRDKVQNWMKIKNSFNSLYEHFMGYYMHNYIDAKVICNYICALVEFLPSLSYNGIDNICSGRNWVRDGVNLDKLQTQIISIFEYAIETKPYLEKINHLLTCFYTITPDYCDPDEISLDLLSLNQLSMLASKSLAKYIKYKGLPSPCEISKKSSTFHTFLVSACYVDDYYMEDDEFFDINSNLMCDELIKQYQGLEADIVMFREFIAPYQIETDDPSELESEARNIKNNIVSIFGSLKSFEEFVQKTFTMNEEIKKKMKQILNI